jgi:hypothetical protein
MRNLALTIGKVCATVAALSSCNSSVVAADRELRSFERHALTNVYYSEGANAGELNNDGHVDAVYGPHWYEGPDFTEKHEIYKPVRQDVNKYSFDNFFSWIYDFNSDGWNDILVVGIPGTPAIIYQNPGKDGLDTHWTRHEVLDRVTNESPQFVNIVGDERPELICTYYQHYGFATVDWDKPFAPWTFHKISDSTAPERFGHGLGVGDVNGDGRMDVMQLAGWYEQPAENPTGRWKFHLVDFTNGRPNRGGADMFAYDVDGDGDNDVVTSLAAHEFGLAWFEQVGNRDGEPEFQARLIMNKSPDENRYGLVFSELHGVNLVDMDGDGLKDIVTGKTYWSHHRQAPQWDAGAVCYVFKLVRGAEGVDWVPFLADPDCGIGRQVSVVDVNGDQLPDIVLGGMKGGHILIQKSSQVDEATWQAAQPKVIGSASSN